MSERIHILGLLHPAAVMRGQWALGSIQPRILRRAFGLAAGTETAPALDPSHPLPNSILYPTLDDLYQFKAQVGPLGVAPDIENANEHLICVGFCDLQSERCLCLPFRKQGGEPYWEPEAHRVAVEWLYDLLADPAIPKIFHNGASYDVPYLEELGFTVQGYQFDTLLAHHLLYAELPKSLGFLAVAYEGFPLWKRLVIDDAEGEGKA